MSLEDDLKRAERAGATITKENLIKQLKESSQREFVVVQGRRETYIVVRLRASRQ